MKGNKTLLIVGILFMILSTAAFLIGCPQPTLPIKGDAGSGSGNSSGYKAGTIVLQDGSFVSRDSYSGSHYSNPPVAVLIGTKNSQGKYLGIGLHTKSDLQWASGYTTGYKTKFTGIICTPQYVSDQGTFAGDTDGSDNWEYICDKDPSGTQYSQVSYKYPAFDWVNGYDEEYSTGGKKWYMPSLAELYEVYKNRDAINASMSKIQRFNSGAADSGLGTDYYWSSSQSSDWAYKAWQVNFSNGTMMSWKDDTCRVCCFAAF